MTTSYRGFHVDFDSMIRDNSDARAVGNMRVNANGDQLGAGGMVTKTADQIARAHHRIQTNITSSSLKGAVPESPELDIAKPAKARKNEKELDNGDIVSE